MRKLPKNMKLGVATAAYQVEGGWNVSGKTPSIWDVYCHIPGSIKDGTTAEEACKSYEFYKRDILMLKYLGVDFYRFSISWPRVLPNGFANVISKSGIDYYNKVIDELLENGIEPIVTIYHWDLPQNLQDLGGWANPLITEWFEDYARVLYEEFGDRVKTWITMNEPKQFAVFGYGTFRFAPNIVSRGIGDYMAIKNLLLAHARAWHLYDKEYRDKQKGICGITIATDFREGASDSAADIETGKLALDFEVGLYSHPIFSSTGGFPERVVKRIAQKSAEQGFPRSRLPKLSPEEIEYIKGTSDFYGFNHYSTKFYTEDLYVPGMFPIPSYDDDIGAVGTYLDYEPAPVIHTTPIPSGMRKALNWVRETYNNPPIMITENGYGTMGGLKDRVRIKYFNDYLNAVLDAVDDGCNVISYTAWSLMDNFEWDSGLSAKFGIFEVDFTDEQRPRKARSSAIWYRYIIATRTLNSNYEPELQDITF
ncbi:myrosinase 1-like [Anticarsia gemmatalis]|uniref:myrosinase 1-like n=1 Tax=Anticarsia gemmatalis TaxID=129554 RepID=UPI003F776CE9